MLLTHSITHNSQIIEISVYYSPITGNVIEIKSIWIHSMGSKLPVTGILLHLFQYEIKNIVAGADWKGIYDKALGCDFDGSETNGINMNNIDKHITRAIAPHT